VTFKIETVYVSWPSPFQGWFVRFVIRGLGLANINLPTKLDVSISNHYEDMKSDTKCEKWGGFA